MIKLNILLAIRNLGKQKLYSVANILGLTIGIFSFLSIYMYNQYQLSFDRFHDRSENIYRLWDTFSGSQRQVAMMPFKWTRYLEAEFPEIEKATSIQQYDIVVKKGDEVINERDVIVADTGFFKIFDFPVLEGVRDKFFKNPRGVILERNTAIKYFGSPERAMHQSMTIGITGNFMTFNVEGVVACPSNSHLQFDFLLPFEPVIEYSFNPPAYESFSTHFIYTYVHIPSRFDHDLLQKRFKDFLLRHGDEALSARFTTSVQPLHNIYLDSTHEFDFTPRGSRQHVNILWIVAAMVLLISGVNFINLYTARWLKRIKEVGIRKVFGADRNRLIAQFLVESILISTIAAIIAVLAIIAGLDLINQLAGVEFLLRDVLQPWNLIVALMIAVAVGTIAALYPAYLISSFGTLQILRSNDNPLSVGNLTRKVLITLQFCIAVALIVGTLVVGGQLNYMAEKDLGITPERVVLINDGSAISNDKSKVLLLRNELRGTDIVAVTSSSTHPGVTSWSVGFRPEGYDEQVSYPCIFTDHDFAKTYGIEIVKGRDLDIRIHSDSLGFLVNEAAVKLFSNVDSTWKINPIGKTISSSFPQMNGPVIGVMKDFHFESVHSAIKPLIVMVYPKFKSSLQIRLKSDDITETLDRVEEVWARLFPQIPFDYQFVDDVFDQSFKSDRQLSRLFQVFAGIAVLLAMMGLFALSSFMAKEKLKSSSIKKVLGATIFQVIYDLIRQIMVLVVVALLLALPLAYFLMNNWLASFPYRIEISVLVLAVVAITIILVSLLTVSYHAYQLANSNPIKLLRQD